jgi:hypothetical protein
MDLVGPLHQQLKETADSQLSLWSIHEMGRRKTTREHQSTNNSEVLLAKHNLQIWSSERIDR